MKYKQNKEQEDWGGGGRELQDTDVGGDGTGTQHREQARTGRFLFHRAGVGSLQ